MKAGDWIIDQVILTAPCGMNDVSALTVKPTLYFMKSREKLAIYEARICQKTGS